MLSGAVPTGLKFFNTPTHTSSFAALASVWTTLLPRLTALGEAVPRHSMSRNSGIQALLPMKTLPAILIMLAALSAGQIRSESAPGDTDPDLNAAKITNGPVVEYVNETTAVIAWSTNVSAGTVLHFGTDPNHLDQMASMPWGGLTHRVHLKDLTP